MRLVALVLCVAGIAAADAKKYTLPDLKALVDSKAYREAVEHLGDVAPRDRNADWIDVAGKASVGYVLGATTSAKLDAMLLIERSYPMVLQAPRYLVLRAQLAPAAFAHCFQTESSADCRDLALQFVDADPKNGSLQLAMAKVIRRGMSSAEASVPFFTRALGTNKPAIVCPDDDLELAVIAGLGLATTDPRSAATAALANGCWSDLRESVSRLTWQTGETHDHACALLRAHKESSRRCP